MNTHNTTINKLAASAILVAALLLSAAAQAAPCASVFEALYPENASPQVRKILGQQNSEISYGLEAEFNIKKAPGVLEWYRPSSITDERWQAMSLEEKKSSVNGSGYGMVKTSRAPEWLLDKLSSDPGGAELITKPTNKLETALQWINEVERTAGGDGVGRSKAFYWQGNVAYQRADGGAWSRTQRDGIEGYVKVTADLAQLGKLHDGYNYHKQKSSFIPGKNLHHFVLGPMNTDKTQEIKQELDAAGEGRSTNRHSHYLQGTYFRTWAYGEGRNGFETRDPHKDVGVLKREMRRMTHGLQKGFDAYKPFKNIKMLDETGDFNKFSDPVKTMLGSMKYKKPDGTTGSIMKGRYALPMRAYEDFYPKALGLSNDKATTFKSKVKDARSQYVQTLERIAGDSALDVYARRDRVHVAIAKFAHDSGVHTAIDGFMSQVGQR